MKIRITFTILTLCFLHNLIAQKKVFELVDGFSHRFSSKKESYSLSNQVTNDLVLLFQEGNQIKGLHLDAAYKEVSKFNTESLSSKYKNLLGYNVENSVYSIFFSNTNRSKFGVLEFDFSKKSSTIKILKDFKLKGEVFLEAVNYKNKMFLLTVTKKTSNLNLYSFDKDYNVEKKTVSLAKIKHPKSKNIYRQLQPAADPLNSDFNLFEESEISLKKIEPQNPNVIETTSEVNKLYLIDNQLIFSFDKDDKKTTVAFINLETFETNLTSFDKPASREEGYKKSNSYIFENKIFQVASSNQKMKFTITDISTHEIIKQYAITKEDSITFKNSPIIQEGGGMFPALTENRIREMEKTAKYLRKISSSNLGISVYKVNNEYNIILGGTKEINNVSVDAGGGGFAPGFGGGITITTGNAGSQMVSVGFNPTYYAYNGYSSTKSTYINCLFDENFEHLEGDVQRNVYDNINDFEDTLGKRIKVVNVFIHYNNIHYGFFDADAKAYKIYTFQD
ncbi:hypothetical protein GCM10022393_08580 [Aquimarina addita]|uniref:Uncharacterized protein n=1 Tax=Aquimarina addita TaxID=870485 RepID=A0ABP7XD87_9FLAO